jgi:hypothetical protein
VGTVVAFIRALLAGLTPTYDKQRSFEADVLYKINHTSQVWSIEAVLNDIFDADSRRIYIKDAEYYKLTELFPDPELKHVTLQPDAGGDAWVIHPDELYKLETYDFVIMFPYVLTTGEESRARALVDYYRLAGKRHRFNYELKITKRSSALANYEYGKMYF